LSKTVNGVTTRYLSVGNQEIAEYDGSNTLLRRYVFGPHLDEPLATIDGSGNHFYHFTDARGSIVALVSSTGAISEKHAYTGYGMSASATGTVFQFAGRRIDAETGLYYYRARYYSPSIGRFLQNDPIGTDGGLHLYAYVGNDPLNNADPMGTNAETTQGATQQFFAPSSPPTTPQQLGTAEVNSPTGLLDVPAQISTFLQNGQNLQIVAVSGPPNVPSDGEPPMGPAPLGVPASVTLQVVPGYFNNSQIVADPLTRASQTLDVNVGVNYMPANNFMTVSGLPSSNAQPVVINVISNDTTPDNTTVNVLLLPSPYTPPRTHVGQ
jgi:RHS repeat-associated protein